MAGSYWLSLISVDDLCLEFGPADSQIILRPRPDYVAKVPTTPFRARWWACKLCQLFVWHGGRQKGNAVSKQRMAHLTVDAITLAYQVQGVRLARSGWELTLQEVWHPPGRWLVAPRWQIFVELRAGRPLTRSLDAIAFVWNWFPPVFSPQMDRSTEGLRFQVSLLKTTPESPYCRPCPPSPQQPNVAEHPASGPHSVNPWEPVEGWVPYVETVWIPYVSRPVATAAVPPLSGRIPARLLSENLNMRCTCCLLILMLWSAAAGCNNRMAMYSGSFSLHKVDWSL